MSVGVAGPAARVSLEDDVAEPAWFASTNDDVAELAGLVSIEDDVAAPAKFVSTEDDVAEPAVLVGTEGFEVCRARENEASSAVEDEVAVVASDVGIDTEVIRFLWHDSASLFGMTGGFCSLCRLQALIR